MATHELQMLEESLQRNKADIKSSESLVEQYRWQATQARYKLRKIFFTKDELALLCSLSDFDFS